MKWLWDPTLWMKILIVVAVVSLWFPFAFALLLAFNQMIAHGIFVFDYLLPAELFWLEALGLVSLIGVAVWRRRMIKRILWTIAFIFMFLVSGLSYAVLTGLANGTIEPDGIELYVTAGLLIAFDVGLVACGFFGFLLAQEIFQEVPVEK